MAYIIHITPDLCTGCRICEIGCSLRKTGECNPTKSSIRIIKNEREGLDIPSVCMQCEEAFCMDVCPVNALTRDQNTHAVILNREICVGCRMCIVACPFGGLSMDHDGGKPIKCDLCDGDPFCCSLCPTGAIQYVSPDLAVRLDRRLASNQLGQPVLRSRQHAAR